MSEDNNIEETLWNYIEGGLRSEDIAMVEVNLQTNDAWKKKYAELTDLHLLLQNHMELEQPSMRFTQNIMEAISKTYIIAPLTTNYLNKNVIRGIGAFFLTSITALIIYGVVQVNWSAGEASHPKHSTDWSQFYNSTFTNVFMMINIILALMVMDMYLTKRKKKHAAPNP